MSGARIWVCGILLPFLVGGFPASAVFAQQALDAATVAGRVADPSDAPAAGALVTLRDTDRNRVRDVHADGRGRFVFLYVPPGQYSLIAVAAGFDSQTISFPLSIGQTLDVPITLLIPGVAATVDVRAEPPALDPRRTQAADTVRRGEIDALPLNGRNFLDLALLAPGVSRTVQRNTERFAETSAVPGTGLSVGGQRNLSNTFIVDGLSANDDAAGLAGTYFAEDVIREFQIVTSGGIAEFGRASSGIINIVTQSGSNALSMRGYGFFRDEGLDARPPLAARKDPLRQAQYGASLSGPLVRDRTFVFANVERTDLQRTGTITVPAVAVEAINAVLTRTAYPGQPVAAGAFTTGHAATNVFGRVDHGFSSATRLAARYSAYDVSSANARNVGGLNAVSRGTRLDNRDHTLAVNLLSSPSQSLFAETRAQVTRSRLGAVPNDLVGPAVTIAGVASFGTATASPTARDLDMYELSQTVTSQRGGHLLKAGAAVLTDRLTIVFPGALQGAYTFPSLAAFQAGRYVNFQQAFGTPSQFQASPNVGVFVQDEWRPLAALTVNAGLRYDVQWLSGPVRTDTNNLSPRVGLAFAPGSGRTVVRASGGVYYDRLPLRAVSNALQRDGVQYRLALLSASDPAAPVFPRVLAAFPAGTLTGITSIDPQIENGAAGQLNAYVERQLARDVFAGAGYVHLSGRHIIMSRNVNAPTLTAAEAEARGVPNLGRPDPRIANNNQYQSIGVSAYNALTLSARVTRPSANLRLAYTFSRALDDAGNAFFSSPQDNARVHDDYGRSDNDQRQRLIVSGTTHLPGRVDIACVFSYGSAPPFNIQTGTDRNGDTNVNDRPVGTGRNTGRGFDTATLDLRLSRGFRTGGRARAEVIIDAFNVLNRSNFLIPNNIIGTGPVPAPGFGTPTAAADPRQVQLGLRWTF